jgi:hypothetical protein
MFPTLFGALRPKRSDAAPGQDRSGSPMGFGRRSTEPVRREVLSPEGLRLVLEDGLLMALGPEGDPVPPEAFAVMASESPDAIIPLASGGEVPAGKAAAVLQAQASGKLVAGEQGDHWVAAMLGVGPHLEMASAEELQTEVDPEAPQSGTCPRPVWSDESSGEAYADDLSSAIPLDIEPPCPEGLDATRVSVIALSSLPEGSVLSAGADEGRGRWLLTASDLEGLFLRVPRDCPESVVIKVTALAVTGQNGELASAHADLVLEYRPVPPISTAEQASSELELGSVHVDFDPGLLTGPAIDVVVIRDVPAGFSLSAGIHDASIHSWVLKPAEMVGLRIHADDGAAGQFTITVLGIGLGRDAPRQARVLDRIPIAFD